ncbi:hypothetical protein A6A04_06080 [Paramagnetospirillum marisnigri]|uniref:Uncharacterized protein n=1 Tax=Paramagnetospirillum marisnigri TaxID=1285242 RepID=A0A178MCY1_9PROT|nr:hypothetical protein [Paramagnetospirillum marisnigri]OAN46670.1 hypothetical protein A6A04_06080 [Paramagnetospirillum marisnigri]
MTRRGLAVLILAAVLPLGWAAGEGRLPLLGEYVDRSILPNPYAHIPAQCHIETSGGLQNACRYCHTNGPAAAGLGNNSPQAGASLRLGNLQEDYSFVALRHPFVVNGSVNPWTNTLFPATLRAELDRQGHRPEDWDMDAWISQDNWTPAFAKRPGSVRDWDAGVAHPLRLFPALDPADLPASPQDGFVRSRKPGNGLFQDGQGFITGWRAVNFFPYGIFTPRTGSVSGIYIRLPERFMKDGDGRFDLGVYAANLERLRRAIQDRLGPGESHYLGAAAGIAVERGLYPLGTEFAHPLHYVEIGPGGAFPGTRARRVKEIRTMVKLRPWSPDYGGPEFKEEDAPVYGNGAEGWVDNGTGWLMSGYIEDRDGALRPQTLSELVQCVGCHSGNTRATEKGYAAFTAGTGNTIDSTWALPRALDGASGWREMDYLGYVAEGEAGRASLGDRLNRASGQGEFRAFLDNVVGLSLYGDIPEGIERFLAATIRTQAGYSRDWPKLDTSSSEAFLAAQAARRSLLRELTALGGHLAPDGTLRGELLYPSRAEALAAATRYRQVVATQRYDFGKDVFADTPVTFRHFRPRGSELAHQDGRPYGEGEVVTDRPIDTDSASFTYGIGIAKTLITPEPSYLPLLGGPPTH